MNIHKMKSSRFLQGVDVDPPMTLTIKGCKEEDVSLESQPTDMKHCLYFQDEGVKPLVLNWTNITAIADVLKSEESDDWTGKQITLYYDRNIMFAGKKTGGIRVRHEDAEDLPF